MSDVWRVFRSNSRVLGIVCLIAASPLWADAQAPEITNEPIDRVGNTGDDLGLTVTAAGASPLTYQWQRGTADLPGETGSLLRFNPLEIGDYGDYRVIVSNASGSVTSRTARVAVDDHLTFRILDLLTNGVLTVDHDALTGDDRGGVAVSGTHVFVTGDISTARYTAETLEQGTALGTLHQALVSDLRDGTLFLLGNGDTPLFNPITITTLLPVDGATGQRTGGRIDLSTPIDLAGDVGIFAGYGRIVLHTGIRVYAIDVPSGYVTDLGAMSSPAHWFAETWAYWGLAEYIGGRINLVYVRDPQSIMRQQAPDGAPVVLSSFQNLGDMHSLGFSVALGRWFFHHEGGSQLGNGSEVLGSAKALFTTSNELPYITETPANLRAFVEGSASFHVTAIGQAPLHYQWRRNGADLPGATNASLTLDNLQSQDAGEYTVVVSNTLDAVESAPATLAVVAEPLILQQPDHVAVPPGTNVTFFVDATGPPPLHYQWRHDGTSLPGQTNSVLNLTDVRLANSGAYSVAISNRFGVTFSSDAILTVLEIVDDGSIFRIQTLSAENCAVVDHDNVTGDDRGGIAASSTHVFVTGDNGTGRYALDNLSGGTRLPGGLLDGMVANLRTETVYLLGNGDTPLSSAGGTLNTLLELSNTGQITGRRIDLNRPFEVTQASGQVGLFSGYGRVVIHTGTRVYSIALPSGQVLDLGVPPSFFHNFSESWAYWGIAEHYQGHTYLVYVRDSISIVRTRLPDGLTQVVASFSSLSDAASITLSLSRRRWYFHYEGSGQFGGQSETLGYCGADVLIDSGSNPDQFRWDPIPVLQIVGVPFTVTLRAVNTAGQIVTNFNGSARLSARHVTTAQPLMLAPTTTTDFTNGVWTGEITLLEPSPGLVLDAVDRSGNIGTSQPLLASPPNDLVVVVQDQPDPSVLGQPLRYHILVTNTGPAQATAVTLSNALPVDVVFQSVTTSRGSCGQVGRLVWCEFGDLGTEGAVIAIDVLAGAIGTLTNITQVYRQETDALPFNNLATTLTTVTLPVLRINDPVVLEGNAGTTPMVFSVTLTPAWTNTVRVSYTTVNGTAIGSGSSRDFTGRSGTLTFPAGTTNQLVEITIHGDTLFEIDEQFPLQLFSAFGAFLADTEGIGTILNDDPAPRLALTDASVVEPDAGLTNMTFQLVLSEVAGAAITARYRTIDDTATAETDFLPTSGEIIFASGTRVLTQTVTVPIIGDRIPEGDETFFLELHSISNAVADTTRAVGTIIDNEGPGILDYFEIGPISSPQLLGQPFEVMVTARDILGGAVTSFNQVAELRGLAGQPPAPTNMLGNLFHEFVQPEGSFTIGFAFTPTNDMTVTGVRHYSGTKVSIWSDDGVLVVAQPVVSTPGTWIETPLAQPVTLLAGNRYRVGHFGGGQPYYWVNQGAPSTFALGRIDFAAFGFEDTFPTENSGEPPFLFMVDLVYLLGPPAEPISITPLVSGQFMEGVWVGLVQFDEPSNEALLEVSEPSGRRGRSERFLVADPSDADLELTARVTPEVAIMGNLLTYDLTVSNRGPAAAQSIVLSNSLPSGVILLAATSSHGSVETNVMGRVLGQLGDLEAGSSATLTITVRPTGGATLTNRAAVFHGGSDPSPANNQIQIETAVLQPALSVQDITVVEGDSGTNLAVFVITLYPPSQSTVRVSYTTVNGTATGSGSTRDFIPRSGQLTFTPGTTNLTVSVPVLGDTRYEEDEYFPLQLFAAFGARLDVAEAIATILNDDARPALSVSDINVVEGHTGATQALFQVILTAASGQNITVRYNTSDGSALAGQDYGARAGTLTFSGGTTVLTQTVVVPVFGDATTEPDEQFFLQLLDANGADLSRDRASATILNDDFPGEVSRFVFDPLPNPSRAGESLLVRVRALDGVGELAANFTDSVALSAISFEGNGRHTLFGSLLGPVQLPAGATYGFGFVANANLLVTEVKHLSGMKVSLWTDDGQLLSEQAVPAAAGSWVTTPLSTPVALQQGGAYRLGVYSPSGPVAARTDLDGDLSHIDINQGYEAAGDMFPNTPTNIRWPLVDFVYSLGTPRSLSITPTASEAFVDGVWDGSISVEEPGRAVVLRARDQAQHTGESSAFDILLADDLQLSLTVSDQNVIVGQPVEYQVTLQNPGPTLATGVVVTNTLSEGLSVLSTQTTLGSVLVLGQVVIWDVGDLPTESTVTLTIHVTPELTGTGLATHAIVTRAEPDPDLANNSASVLIDVRSPIINGSFETGTLEGWIVQDLNPSFVLLGARPRGFNLGFNIYSLNPTDGNFAASHGYAGDVGVMRLAQDVSVPTQLSQLAFDYRVGWVYFNFGLPKDFRIQVQPRGGGPPLLTTNLLTLEANENLDTGPLTALIDLSPFAGGTVRISFEWPVYTPFDGPGLFQLDNVRFERAPETPPRILEEPQDVSATTGENVSLGVLAAGSFPLSYQWRRQGTPISGATNASLTISNVSLRDAAIYDVVITNPFGTLTSAPARLLIDLDTTFQIVSLETNSPIVFEHENINGDDRGGIAVSASRVFVQGDGAQASGFNPAVALFNIDDLSGGLSLNRGYDALISDLRTERVYSLGNGNNLLQNTNGLNFTQVTSLIELGGVTGLPTGSRVDLSTPIPVAGGSVGLFAGYGRVVIASPSAIFSISLPSGEVTELPGIGFFSRQFTENWAYWGIAEYFNQTLSLVYARDSSSIVRTRLSDGLTVPLLVIPTFPNLSDMASITFSLSRSRWYFHHEGTSIFQNTFGETVGSAKASYTTDPGFPSFVRVPLNQIGFAEETAMFQAEATGGEPLRYQWFFNGRPLAGQNDPTLFLANLSTHQQGYYHVEVSNPNGFALSPQALLTVYDAPQIFGQPTGRSVEPNTNVTFFVSAVGASPLHYQWRRDGVNLPNATNSIFTLPSVQFTDRGLYTVLVSNRFGSTLSEPALLSVFQIVDDGAVFRITHLGSNVCQVVDHNGLTGDDRGGIAASSTHVFYTGDNRTGRFSLDDLGGPTAVGEPRWDALVSDLRTETVYTLANGNTPLTGSGTITSLLEHNNTGQLTGRRVDLSSPVPADGSFDQVGIFAGHGRVVIYSAPDVYSIALPSGRVTLLGSLSFLNHQFSENWAFWGVTELIQGYTYLTYARFDDTIVRTRLPDGTTTVLASFQNLSDMAAFTVSLSRRRWYFHYEGNGQFGGTSETIGYCDAQFEVRAGTGPDRFEWRDLPSLVQVGVPFQATLVARTADGLVSTNFSGLVSVEGVGGAAPIPSTLLSNFVDGVWTGMLSINTVAVDIQLLADDFVGHTGLSAPITVAPENDLAVLVQALPDPAIVVAPFSYLLSVTNLGPASATAVLLTNLLPPEVTLLSVSNSQGTCQTQAGIVHCDLGLIAGGQAALVEIRVSAPALPGILTNQTFITRAEPDPLPENNSKVQFTTVVLPSVSIADATLAEGDSGTTDMIFEVNLSAPRSSTVRVSYTTLNGTAVGSGSRADFTPRSGQLTFQPGVTNLQIVIPIRGDLLHEADETFVVQLFGAFGAQLLDAQGEGRILNDDGPPTLTITDVDVLEGNSGATDAVFELVLSEVTGLPVTVVYATSNGTARAGSDYLGVSGSLTFQANSTALTQTVVVSILGDTTPEPDEVFYLNLLSVSDAIVLRSQATATIRGDDGIGELHHFQWNVLAPSQPVLQPIQVTLTARDVFGSLLPQFNQTVHLSGRFQEGSASSVVISEAQPGTPDSVEFSNVAGAPVDISGWTVYVYDDVLWPAPSVTFEFPPSTVVPADGVFLLTEFGALPGEYPEFNIGSNISWTHSATVNLAVLLVDDVGEVVDFLVAGNGTRAGITIPFALEEEHWDGPVVPGNTVSTTTYQRIGDLDDNNASNGVFAASSLGTRNANLTLPFSGGTMPLAISPNSTTPFVNGSWTGTVTILEPALGVTLEARVESGAVGYSLPFHALPTADLAVILHAHPYPVPLNGDLLYSALITNRGPSIAANVLAACYLPPGVTLESASATQGVISTDDAIVWLEIDSLPANASATLTLQLQPHELGLITNRVQLTSLNHDPLLLNNQAQIVTTVWLDSDGDGLSDAYELTHQLDPHDPNDALLDSDGDGQSNLEEARAGTNPHDPQSVMRITSIEIVGNDVCLRFSGVEGRLYRLERQRMEPEPWETVLIFRVGRSLEVKVVDSGGASFPRAIYRVQLAQ